jgi:aryl-alcohol dehydrogenase-like predicted oxidoreductase
LFQVDVYYIHAPDRRVPLQDLLAGLDAVYRAGKFKRLGLSNFLPEEVSDVIRICKENGYVLPTVYQGNYNAVARHSETTLLPILRENNIAFYAYSPIAGMLRNPQPPLSSLSSTYIYPDNMLIPQLQVGF